MKTMENLATVDAVRLVSVKSLQYVDPKIDYTFCNWELQSLNQFTNNICTICCRMYLCIFTNEQEMDVFKSNGIISILIRALKSTIVYSTINTVPIDLNASKL